MSKVGSENFNDQGLIEKCKASRTVFQGRMINLRIDQVELPDGRCAEREIVEHPGAVVIIAVNEEREIVFVRQHRQAVGEVLLEVPAGKLEKCEDPLDCARRELWEETGYTAEQWEKLGYYYVSPGFTDEKMHLFLAKKISQGEARPDCDEFVETRLINIDDAMTLLKNRDIHDAKTLIGIMYARLEERQ